MARAIVILTAGRSGSSALAGALHQAGIPFETSLDNMGISKSFNPKGHFEMRSWWRVGNSLKKTLQNGASEEGKQKAIDAYSAIIERRNKESPIIWGVKSPFSPWTFPVFHSLLPDHRVIVLWRNRKSMIQSVMRHHNNGHGVPEGEASVIVNDYIRQLRSTVQTLECPWMQVHYEQLVTNSYQVLTSVIGFCYDGLAQARNEQIECAVAWIDPKLQHYA